MKTYSHLVAVVLFACVLNLHGFAQSNDTAQLSKQLDPWLHLLSGQVDQFTLKGTANVTIEGSAQPVQFQLVRFDNESFDLKLEHAEYAVELRRRPGGMAFCVPKHKIVYIGTGELDSSDHLKPTGIVNRLVSNGTALRFGTQLIASATAEELAETLMSLAKLKYSSDQQAWLLDNSSIQFDRSGKGVHCVIDGTNIDLNWTSGADAPVAFDAWPEMSRRDLPRGEIEKQLARGVRRALEVLAPSAMLTAPSHRAKRVEHG